MRGGIATGVVVIAVSLSLMFVGFRGEKSRAQKAENLAAAALQDKNFEEAAKQWKKASRHYDTIFDEANQAVSLRHSSDAYAEGHFYPESLEMLKQSSLLSGTPYDEREATIYRAWGAFNLEESQQSLDAGALEEALTEGQDALRFFQRGRASEQEQAAACRQTVAALIELEDFFEAKKQMTTAIDLEGRTEANIAASKYLTRRRMAYEKTRLADSKEHRYISDEDIPPLEVEKPSRRRVKSSSPYTSYRKPKARRARLSVGSESAYPTRIRKTRRRDRDEDRDRGYRSKSFRPAPTAPKPQRNNSKSYSSKYKKPKSTYKRPKSSYKKKRRISRPTRWSGVKTRRVGGSSSSYR